MELRLIYQDQIVGGVHATCDYSDVLILSELRLDSEYSSLLQSPYFLAQLIQSLAQHSDERFKPKFCFMFHACAQEMMPENPNNNRLMYCPELRIPQSHGSDSLIITNEIAQNKLPYLLELLHKNAPWQHSLKLDQLQRIINHSHCFFVLDNTHRLIGFARVLTDYQSFASLWDVVIDHPYRGLGIGRSLMIKIFTHDRLCQIQNWLLITDNAQEFYKPFGFSINTPSLSGIHQIDCI